MKHTPSRASVVVVACLGLVLAGTFAMTPAGANLQQGVQATAQHNWNKIWKQKIRPKSDRRYYTKAKANDRYADQDDVWTKLEADAKYATRADTWTKAEADAKYATKPRLVRGTYGVSENGPAGSTMVTAISYGVALPAPPTTHYVNLGDPVPAGCLGNAEAPDAQPGHLCFFESLATNVNTRTVYRVSPVAAGAASTMGAWVVSSLSAAGTGYFGGSWAVRFDTASSGTRSAPAPSGENLLD